VKTVLQDYLQATRQGGQDAGALDEAGWSEYYATIQRAAETFRDG
jgi:hypothetical protein